MPRPRQARRPTPTAATPSSPTSSSPRSSAASGHRAEEVRGRLPSALVLVADKTATCTAPNPVGDGTATITATVEWAQISGTSIRYYLGFELTTKKST
nr:hypothetical protein [Janibacter melonis]